MEKVLNDIRIERLKQALKWGEQDHPDGTKRTKLVFGLRGPIDPTYEVARDWFIRLTDSRAKMGIISYADILLEEVFEAMAESDQEKLREELVQTAAVAVAWIEKIDRERVKDE